MSDSGRVSVLGICGSLRQASFNMAALRAALAQKPADMDVTVADITQIPLYNEDVRQQGFPPSVETLRRQIKEADALLFACPEYNYSMTGVLKNAIDWASRPPDQPSPASHAPSSAPPPAWPAVRGRNTICGAAASFSTCTRRTSRKCSSVRRRRNSTRPAT